ncbi:adenosylcobinamide-GDP ribazoletransferase [Kordiimonas sp. SCSIO 12603]|uniref:adenosylcobinamide-GDP ribazoletransferase n=1 Tax=Kordiimonas sp. SCSIO 12603 TaxID=2829596 RepID=UPI002105EE2C|nr:adenosylcobinamide-GDP ribazoletransferase [Kordiimonas sp. SCSIO 12603]UTW57415.1 adenosylcobinamide-GDP ribazoletransferase [Kordiimonas sp. SCSIO 12603]
MTDESNKKGLVRKWREDIAAAFMLLTRIPINWTKISDAPPNLGRAMWAYPVVGFFIGGLMSLAFLASTHIGISKELAILIAISTAVFTTGSFHEDGLADVADGFGGGYGKDKKLEIMRDSRIGTYGGLALIIAFSFKFFSLQSMTEMDIVRAMIIVAVISRSVILIPPLILSPARSNSLATEAGKPSFPTVTTAFILSLGSSFFIASMAATIFLTVSALLTTLVFCRLAYKQVGGYSGDILGATQQLSEIAMLITLATLWQAPS